MHAWGLDPGCKRQNLEILGIHVLQQALLQDGCLHKDHQGILLRAGCIFPSLRILCYSATSITQTPQSFKHISSVLL